MEHKHVTFYEHSAARSAVLGLEELASDGTNGNSFSYNRSAMEKQADVIQYLKRLPSNVRATSVDIKRELNIDLEMEDYVLDMMKSNPKLDFEISKEGTISFQYRDKYVITNIMELKQTVERVKSGVLVSDIADCYEGIENDVLSLVVGGEVIAWKNKMKKCLVLYPRGTPFLTKLSGTVTATPGSSMVHTSADLTGEIRRGDAVFIPYKREDDSQQSMGSSFSVDAAGAGSWYRVSTAVAGGGSASAPMSVTSEGESILKDAGTMTTIQKKAIVYHDKFTAEEMPLDGDFDGEQTANGVALRHGCTNDVRKCWVDTLMHVDWKKVEGDEHALESELMKRSLISVAGTSAVRKVSMRDSQKGKEKKRRTVKATSATSTHNTHLAGTELGKLLDKMGDT